jgi:hypothetical protein
MDFSIHSLSSPCLEVYKNGNQKALSCHPVLDTGSILKKYWIPNQVENEKVNCEARETTLGCEIVVNNQNFRNIKKEA